MRAVNEDDEGVEGEIVGQASISTTATAKKKDAKAQKDEQNDYVIGDHMAPPVSAEKVPASALVSEGANMGPASLNAWEEQKRLLELQKEIELARIQRQKDEVEVLRRNIVI